jgi:hypothetical protein
MLFNFSVVASAQGASTIASAIAGKNIYFKVFECAGQVQGSPLASSSSGLAY